MLMAAFFNWSFEKTKSTGDAPINIEEIAKLFNVKNRTIHAILSEQNWGHI